MKFSNLNYVSYFFHGLFYLGSSLLVQQLDVLLEVVDVGHLSVVGRVGLGDRGVPDSRIMVT